MWTDKLNLNEFDAWLSRRTNRIPSGGRDPYTSSMRTASRFISALKGGAESRESQLYTDLTSAQLYDREKETKSELANSLLYNCKLLDVPDNEELSIVLILFLEALRQHNSTYQAIIRFWYYISKKISITELSRNISVSYLISYFSVRESNYAPLEDVLEDLKLANLSALDMTDLRNMELSSNAISGVNKLIQTINSYTTRSARKEMFQALDIMFSFDKVATIDRICPLQKHPDVNKRLKDILTLYYGYFSFSSLLYDDSIFNININKRQELMNQPLQKIYYGAPGTGKSYATKKVVAEYPDTVRTTFHPDSDYSTFVGAYKPTNTTQDKYGLDSVGKTVPIGIEKDSANNVIPIKEKKIEYKFVKQAFLKAYIKAWNLFKDSCADGQELSPQFLVIEEINRGNCAQIFGDLFQLLDRKNGFSEYPIEADEDIQKALLEEYPEDGLSFGKDGLYLTAEQITYINQQYDIVGQPSQKVAEKIRLGQVLVLPPNFYIWATMNTSDQSLFPIDSAFKRRWEWKYVRICEGKKEDGTVLNYRIKFNVSDEEQVDVKWWDFVKAINKQIEDATRSEDKKLGFFFCKPDKKANDTDECNTVISAETFVGKVVFYLWQDVFKDYGFKSNIFKRENGKKISFHDFYPEDMVADKDTNPEGIDLTLVKTFVQKVLDSNKEQPKTAVEE